MKKAFDQNVSRSKPRLRLGLLTQDVASNEETAPAPAAEAAAPAPKNLGDAVKARVGQSRSPRPSVNQALRQALEHDDAKAAVAAVYSELRNVREAEVYAAQVTPAPAPRLQVPAAQVTVAPPPVASVAVAASLAIEAPLAHIEAPRTTVEVQTPSPELPMRELAEPDSESRRERLKERLKAVREHPRPEPLPPTVAEAGVLAVERISGLQAEFTRIKALNLALTQDLEGARRQAEKATEEARLRMDESRRLSQEMEGRVRLLAELEKELSALEGERDDALLALQETRQGLEASSAEKAELAEEIAKRDKSLAESLGEEERLCGELESAREEAGSLRRSLDALSSERDTLARQVAELTAERSELLEARKALEAVHRALSSAAAR